MASPDELIPAFLGNPHEPTSLGQEIIHSDEHEIHNRIARLFRCPSNNIIALEAVIRQSGTSPAQFAASQQALINRINDWRKCAVEYRSRLTLPNEFAVSGSDFNGQVTLPEIVSSVLQCSPNGQAQTQSNDAALIQLLTRQLNQVNSESVSLPDLYINENNIQSLRTLAINQPDASVLLGSQDKVLDGTKASVAWKNQTSECDYSRGAKNNRASQDGSQVTISAIDLQTPSIVRPVIRHGQQNNSANTSDAPRLPGVFDHQENLFSTQLDVSQRLYNAKDVSGSIMPCLENSNQPAASPDQNEYDYLTLAEPFSPPPPPQNSPVHCPAEYLSKTCFAYETPLDMLREVSETLESAISENWESPGTPSLKRPLVSTQQKPGSSLTVERHPPWSQTPVCFVPTNSTEESVSGWSSCGNFSRNAGSYQAAEMFNLKRTSVRTSIDSIDTRASWATWSALSSENDNRHKKIKGVNDIRSYVSYHMETIKALENKPSEQLQACYAFLGLNDLTSFTHEIKRASGTLLGLLGLTTWNNATVAMSDLSTITALGAESSSFQLNCLDQQQQVAPCFHEYLENLPQLLDAIRNATDICIADVRNRFLSKLQQRSDLLEEEAIEALNDIDPLIVLGLDTRCNKNTLTGDMIRFGAAMTDLEIFKYSKDLGTKVYINSLREKVYKSAAILLNQKKTTQYLQ